MPDQESISSRWFNSLTIAIYVAAATVLGNIVTNTLNNRATAETERLRAQSNLVLEIIKTNGNTDIACKNLNFVVRVGLLDDRNGTISGVCAGNTGVPTLPAGATGLAAAASGLDAIFSSVGVLSVQVVDSKSHAAIENARVEVKPPAPLPSLVIGVRASPAVFTTDSTGFASLGMISSLETLTVSKEGYEPLTKPARELLSLTNPVVRIELHQLSKGHRKK